MKISIHDLKELKACPGQIEEFRRLFGKEVRVTEPRCRRYSRSFDWSWLAMMFLDTDNLVKYHNNKTKAFKKYQDRIENLQDKTKARSTWDPKAWDKYQTALVKVVDLYQETIALAFFKATVNQDTKDKKRKTRKSS